MPRLSDSMREGAVSRWLVEDGSQVRRGQEILEVETDKATMAYEAEFDGVLRILVPEGVNVEVGDVIGSIGDGAESATPVASPPVASPPAAQPPAAQPPAAQPPAERSPEAPETPVSADSPTGDRPARRAGLSPLLRRLAREHGVDVDTIVGTGPDGKVLREDIVAAAEGAAAEGAAPTQGSTPNPVAAADERVALTRSQRLVAQRMAESSQGVPDFWATMTVDVTQLLEVRAGLKAAAAPGQGVPTVNDFLVRACALALVDHPRVNASYDEDHLVTHADVNVGVAVATDGGLIVPVVRNADRLSLAEIASVTGDLTARARAGSLTVAELERGTFTISNLGSLGVRSFAPIVNGRQAGILGVGAVTRAVVPVGDAIGIRSLVELTLTSDHRIVYGADAARFLAAVRDRLQAPDSLSAR